MNRAENNFYRVINIIFVIFFVAIIFICAFLNVIDYATKHLLVDVIGKVPGIVFVIIGAGGIFAFSLIALRKKAGRRNILYGRKGINIAVIIISIAFFVFQLIATYSYYFRTDWDVDRILSTSQILSKNETPGWDHHDYYSRYPNNLTLLNIFTNATRMSSVFNIDYQYFIIIIQCIIYCVTGLLLFFAVSRLLKNKYLALFAYIIYLVSVGISPWVTVPYSDSIALLFPTLILFIYTLRPQRTWTKIAKWLVIGFVSYVGYSLKPQVLFMTLAILAILFIHVIFNKRRSKKNLLKGAVCAAGIAISFLVVNNANSVLDIDIDKNKSFGAQHFFMMGMNYDTGGVYSWDDVGYSESFATAEERNKADMDTAFERIGRMGFLGFSNLMVRKTLINYNDGTFSWGYEGEFYKEVFPDKTPLSPFLKNVYYNRAYTGKYNVAWDFFEQCVWMGIVTLSLFAAAFKRVDKETAILMLAIIILTVFESLFEARSRYLFIYLPVYIILAVRGCQNIYSFVSIRLNKRKEIV